MKNLTKENFWDALYEKYPKGVQFFYDWIDKYKKKNNWDKLFNGGVLGCSRASDGNGYDPHGSPTEAPKFHDLPIAMQIGIWIEFVCHESGVHEWEINDLVRYDWKADITAFCSNKQEDLS